MAGTIFGLPLSQQFDDNGVPRNGCKLYLYAAGTSTPSTTYEDFGLTPGLENSWPIVADSSGRIPQFWVADGSYRVRLVSAQGDEVFDLSSVTALGPSSGTSSGGGVSETALIQTGDFIWNPVSGTRTGFVRANGRTIGSSSSGATERASSDCEDLFLYLWNNFSDTLCPVTGGRGANAAADWAANKKIAVLDMRGRTAYGMDDMGSTAAGIIAAATTAGGALGQEVKTILSANLPNTNLTHSLTAATHTHTQQGSFVSGGISANHTHTYSGNTGTESADHTHSGTTGTMNSNTSHSHTYTDKTNSLNNVNNTGANDNVQQGSTSSNTSTVNIDHTHNFTTGGRSAVHTHFYSGTTSTVSSDHTHTTTISGATAASGALAITGTVALGGSGTALATLSPGVAGSWYIKL